MFIKELLSKYKKQIQDGNLNLDNLIIVLKKHTNIDFKKEDLEIKKGVLYIKTTPLKNNVIFIKKEEILNSLKPYNIFNIN